MIKEEKEKQPFIHFGFNRQTITAYKNDIIKVWQDTIYNKDTVSELDTSVIIGVEITNKTLNSFDAMASTIGTKYISVDIPIKKIPSNIIKLNIIERTFGALDIFFGNTELTFND